MLPSVRHILITGNLILRKEVLKVYILLFLSPKFKIFIEVSGFTFSVSARALLLFHETRVSIFINLLI